MKTNRICALLLCTALCAAPAVCLSGCGTDDNGTAATGEVVSEGFIIVPSIYNYVKLSTTPDEYGDTVEQLSNGVSVGVIESMDGWFKVKHGSNVGYVRSSCITFSSAEHEAISTAKQTSAEDTAAETTTAAPETTAAETTENTAEGTGESTGETTEKTTETTAEKTAAKKTEKATGSTTVKAAEDGTYEFVFEEAELLKAADVRYEGHVFFSLLSNLSCDNGTAAAIVDPQYIEGEYFEVEKGIRVSGAKEGSVTVKGTLTPYRWELSTPDDSASKIVISADAPIEFTISANISK